jgi:GT2 family glycosyltransferase
MVSQAVRPEVGAVGAKLFYAQDLIQHAGVLLGMGPDKVAGHAFKGVHKHDTGPMGRTRLIQAYCAVTGACLAVTRAKYLEVGGLDEENLAIAFNDVDFCLKLREHGYTNIWTPYAQLYHYESYSRGYDHSDTIKHNRFKKERDYMLGRWGKTLSADPYYNPNLSKDFDNFNLAWPPYHEEYG